MLNGKHYLSPQHWWSAKPHPLPGFNRPGATAERHFHKTFGNHSSAREWLPSEFSTVLQQTQALLHDVSKNIGFISLRNCLVSSYSNNYPLATDKSQPAHCNLMQRTKHREQNFQLNELEYCICRH